MGNKIQLCMKPILSSKLQMKLLIFFFPPYLDHQYKMTDKKRTTNLLRKYHPATLKKKGNRINQITKKKFERKKKREKRILF